MTHLSRRRSSTTATYRDGVGKESRVRPKEKKQWEREQQLSKKGKGSHPSKREKERATVKQKGKSLHPSKREKETTDHDHAGSLTTQEMRRRL